MVPDDSDNASPDSPADNQVEMSRSRKRTKLSAGLVKLLRRIHLYTGLFLLPWVFLYGITGAMFNHQELLPEGKWHSVPGQQLAETSLNQIPAPEQLAQMVVKALQEKAPDKSIQLSKSHGAAFNNNIILQTFVDGKKHIVHINPVSHESRIVAPPPNKELEDQKHLLHGIHNIKLEPNPYQKARAAVPEIFSQADLGSPSSPRPQGWCKLNFLATVDGEEARVTYVLRDGHIDVTKFTGEDGMTSRHTFLRLHTFHGRSPEWNARNTWSIFIDIMAIAMVSWAITGLVMWWQMKKIRVIGGICLLASIITFISLFFGMEHFHAMTRM